MNKSIIVGFTSVLLGLIFIFSAYTKLFPIEIFEFSFIEIKVANWTTAPFIARLFLAMEFLLGMLLVFNFNGGNHKLAKITIGLLLVFIIYLIAIIFIEGNDGNCGCFGNYIKMTPLESIVKNIILITLTSILFLAEKKTNFSSKNYIVLASAIAATATPFILNPVTTAHPHAENEINYELKLDSLYAKSRTETPKTDLRKGKRVIAFLSLTCPHCKIGAQKLNIIHNQHPELPIYFILNGDQSSLKSFLNESKTVSVNYSFMSLKEGFIDNAGLNLPAILWVNNNKVENRTKYTELDENLLLQWYNK
jgi:hypothetical protein